MIHFCAAREQSWADHKCRKCGKLTETIFHKLFVTSFRFLTQWFIFWKLKYSTCWYRHQKKRLLIWKEFMCECAAVEKSTLPFWLFSPVLAGNGILLKSLLCVWLAGPCTVHTSQDGRWKDFRFASFQRAAFCCVMRLCVETMSPH